MNTNLEYVKNCLSSKGLKPSLYRIAILKYLLENKNHPTVDMIYQKLIIDMPTISKTTVYNTLESFVDNKIAQVITIEENEARFDADITTHGHFKCEECGSIHDFKINLPDIRDDALKGFKVEEKHIYFKGVCVKCNK